MFTKNYATELISHKKPSGNRSILTAILQTITRYNMIFVRCLFTYTQKVTLSGLNPRLSKIKNKKEAVLRLFTRIVQN